MFTDKSSLKTMLLLPMLFLILAVNNRASAELHDIKKLALANNDLAFNLYKSFNSQGNCFFSPASISIALGMLYQGARDITAEEMRHTLSYDIAGLDDQNLKRNFQELLFLIANSSDAYKLDIANAIISQDQYLVSDEYKETLKNYYGAILKELDFINSNTEALEEINKWVSNKTQGKIPRLLESLDPDTVLVLLNAVYFKGAWKHKFISWQTRNETFYNDGHDPVSIPMMNAKKEVHYGEEQSFKALKYLYEGGDISMVFLLPNDRNGLSEMEQKLNASKLDRIISSMENMYVGISIPKFKLEDSYELKAPLMSLGMKSVFSDRANLNGISEEGKLKVSKIIHKAVVEVNEEGSEAAGGTAIQIVPISSSLPTRYSFVADHPFLFFIRDERTGMILFFGRVSEL